MGKSELILEGGKRVRRRKASPQSWTKAKEKEFLAGLAESCNVKLAAKTAGVSTSQAYVRRANNASFRAAWDQALSIGYSQLEMMLLERALHGVEKTVVARDGTTTVMREYSDRVALALLRMHRDNASLAGESVEELEHQKALERIVERLQRLREVETKSLPDRLNLIGWALRNGPSLRSPSAYRLLPQGKWSR